MRSRPSLSWSHLGLVIAGGTAGVALRAGLLLITGPGWQVVAVPVINILGAFLLGVLTGALSRIADTPRARGVRQILGTGVLGGFTTYSTFAVEAVSGAAAWLTLATAVVGVLAALAGVLLTAPRSAVTETGASATGAASERARAEGDDA